MLYKKYFPVNSEHQPFRDKRVAFNGMNQKKNVPSSGIHTPVKC